MGTSLQLTVEKAIAELVRRNVFKKGSAEFEVRALFPVQSWQLHTEPCHEAGSVVIGNDSCGNLFLHAPDGSVSFWDHETDGETVLAPSVQAFCASLTEPEVIVFKPEQVKKVWIDPNF